MPNGSDLTLSGFRALEEPLQKVDGIIRRFAESIQATIQENYHGHPSRSVIVESQDGIRRSISIQLVKPTAQSRRSGYNYAFTLGAGKKIGGQAYQWHCIFRERKTIPAGKRELTNLLGQCWKKVRSVREADLEPVVA
ncbi:MAG TPA: hypothetical protein VMP11_05330 [Verrucomicrobiae bacterium]|nr:hypothetical protein [Verrucomicrobiae bacterium]